VPINSPKAFARILTAGIVGSLLLLAGRFLPAGPDMVASLAAVPLTVAYWCGRAGTDSTSGSRVALGALLGVLGMIFLVACYYVTLWVIGQTESRQTILFFGLVGLAGGALAGGLAALDESKQDLGAAFLGSLYIGEALFFRSMWSTPWLMLYAGIGLISIILATSTVRARLVALILCCPGVLIVFVIWNAVPDMVGTFL